MTTKTETEHDDEPAVDIDTDAGYAADNLDVPEPAEAAVLDDPMADLEAEEPEPEPAPVEPDWQSRFQALERQIAEFRATPAAAVASTPEPVEPDPWKALQDDYPDIADPIRKLLERQQAQFGQALADVQARSFEESMDAARPDWRELREDKAFGDWLKSHPEQQQVASQPGVRAALNVIKAYDAHKTAALAVQEKRQARLKAAETAPTKGSRAPSLSDALDGWAAD